MERHITSLGFLVIFVVGSCYAHNFHVGGKDGWVVDPRESYNHWAERNRFQVNDTLVFRFKEGSDSVLVVNKEAYHTCNKTNPQQTLDVGNLRFKFERSGPFYFISGHDTKCEHGQKLIIVVMAVRHHPPPTPAPKINAPAPVTPPTPALVLTPPPSSTTGETENPAPEPATSAAASTLFGGWILAVGLSLNLFVGL